MIDKDNFKSLLDTLGFISQCTDYYTYTGVGYSLSVDFSNELLVYPEDAGLTIYERTTCNFHQNENFVVFECVYQLLKKGYRPQDIALEPAWHLGHDQKSGRADIVVSKDEKVFLIIECKTAGKEFSGAVKDTEKDGAQLFSYWQQEPSTQWLSLYSSDADGTHKCKVIRCADDPNILKSSQTDDSILTYKKALNNVEKFRVWDEVYGKEWLGDIIFGSDNVAYDLSIKPLRYENLVGIVQSDSGDIRDNIVNRFLEILRHNNVSDKENAFNRLIALFICKLVDEKTSMVDNSEVQFQYKPFLDTYESLQDRLQRLYQHGMADFLGEQVFYVEDKYARRLFEKYQGKDREKAIDDLETTIKKLKYYTNNDFAFKDVHNEKLFLQNGCVLVEVVQLFQGYRIFYTEKKQLLGDIFERLLNNGFKQDEGQFFTPTPITQFIWESLPVGNYISDHNMGQLPRVLDYACGAAHFLTEGISKVKQLSPTVSDSEIAQLFYGIEKDYRLARVSKVALFMYGAGDANVIYGDGLENYEGLVEPNTFDILVANPPYSVKDFKNYLKLKHNTLSILAEITNTGKEIETLFVERISQLLKSGGIAAVILPSSLLTNTDSSYIAAREMLFKHTYIRAIVALPSGTFGKTGTTTVVLFLEKYMEPPIVKNIRWDAVNSIMTGSENTIHGDTLLLQEYIRMQGVEEPVYRAFIRKQLSVDQLQTEPYFKDYFAIKGMTYEKVLAIERQKLYYFSLVRGQQTCVVTIPNDANKKKEVLGYSWSNRKGSEGIQLEESGGLLYDPKKPNAVGTIAHCIKNSFYGGATQLTNAKLANFVHYYPLMSLVDFDKAVFNKTISLTPRGGWVQQQVTSKYPLVKLGEVVDIIRGVTYDKSEQSIETTNNIVLTSDNISLGGFLQIKKQVYLKTNNALVESKRLKQGDCFMCFASGSKEHVGKVCYIDTDTNYYAGGFMGILRANGEKILPHYLYYILNINDIRNIIRNSSTGSNINNLSNNISTLSLPLPPLDVQEAVVRDCEVVDKEVSQAQQIITQAKGSIEELTDKYQLNSYPKEKLEGLLLDVHGSSIRIPNDQVQLIGKYPVISQETDNLITGYTDNEDCITDLPLIVFGDHSCSFKYVDFPFLRGADGTQLLKTDETKIYVKFLYYFLPFCPITNKGHYERHFKYLKDILIPVPPLSVQEALVGEAEGYEVQIAEAQKVIDDSAVRKEKIVKDYIG